MKLLNRLLFNMARFKTRQEKSTFLARNHFRGLFRGFLARSRQGSHYDRVFKSVMGTFPTDTAKKWVIAHFGPFKRGVVEITRGTQLQMNRMLNNSCFEALKQEKTIYFR